jgi:hypothetical protein
VMKREIRGFTARCQGQWAIKRFEFAAASEPLTDAFDDAMRDIEHQITAPHVTRRIVVTIEIEEEPA